MVLINGAISDSNIITSFTDDLELMMDMRTLAEDDRPMKDKLNSCARRLRTFSFCPERAPGIQLLRCSQRPNC